MASEQPVTVSREDLYKQVWEKPMSRLAEPLSGAGAAQNRRQPVETFCRDRRILA